MAKQPLALTLPLDDPARTAAQVIADRLSEGRPVARNDLLAGMTFAFDGSSADGLWSLRDAYDVLELAQILHLKNTTLGTSCEYAARPADRHDGGASHAQRA